MNLTFTIPGEPVAQPRPKITTIHGRARGYVLKSHPIYGYRERVRIAAHMVLRSVEGIEVLPAFVAEEPVSVTIHFEMAPPKHSKIKSGPRPKRPDIENLAKGVLDALTGTMFYDDGQVTKLVLTKRYSMEPKTTIVVAADAPPRAQQGPLEALESIEMENEYLET